MRREFAMKKFLLVIVAVGVLLTTLIAVALFATSGLAGAAERFFADVRSGNADAAHAWLSADFRASTERDALRRFLDQSGLSQATDVTWTERSVENARGRLAGTVTRIDGSTTPISLHLLREDGEWRIHALQLSDSGAAGAVPVAARQALVRRSMGDFATSVNAASMAHFHGSISALWRRQSSIADLDQAFGGLFGRGVDFGVLAAMTPVLGPDSEGDADADGVLAIDGWFDVPPNRVLFEQRYVAEGLDWRLLSFGYEVK
jgi:hypothetical protein